MSNSKALQHRSTIDSLTANEFAVELNDERLTGIFRVIGLSPFKLEVKTTTQLKAIKEPFQIVKMFQRDPANPINAWMRETAAAGVDIVRPSRTLAVLALDGGVEVRRWTFKGAWISAVSYSDFNTGSGDLIEETITIQWDEVEIEWDSE